MRRSLFDLSFVHQTSFDMGQLIPIAALDVLPGDTFRAKVDMLARVAPLATPVMHPVQLRVHAWFVPNRLIWDDWEAFIVGNEGAVTYPTITPATAGDAILYDYMGAEPVGSVAYDALPVRAYNLIWNEYYRDQDLASARALSTASGADSTTATTVARVAWAKDYFTTARANSQQGSGVTIDFSTGLAPVDGIGWASGAPGTATETDVGVAGASSRISWSEMTNGTITVEDDGGGYPNIYADLSAMSGGITVDDLRTAIATQRIAEAREFFGSRYADYLRWIGVNPSDGRLNRPEYLGGGRQTISFSEVLATAEGTTVNPGDLFGHGIAGLRSRPIRKFFEEHGWFIVCLSARPKGIYQNGIPKKFLRRDPTDFWHREMELLPWQAIDQLEIYGGGSAGTVFGYTPRFDEYRETCSYVSNTMRGGTEEDWTLAREFASAPTLNESFITCTPSDRIYQDTSMPELVATIRNSITAKRAVRGSSRMSSNATL